MNHPRSMQVETPGENAVEQKLQNISFDGSSTLVSSGSSDGDIFEVSLKPNKCFRLNIPRKRWILPILIVFWAAVIFIGYRIGWMVGERRNPLKQASNEPDRKPSLTPTTTASTGPSSTPTMAPSIAPTIAPSIVPTETPSITPSTSPTWTPTSSPTLAPTQVPTAKPSNTPTSSPTWNPTKTPTTSPTWQPTKTPVASVESVTKSPSPKPFPSPEDVEPKMTYIPGNLTRMQEGLLLSEGLQARIIARSGEPVIDHFGSRSEADFHIFPDAGATFPDTRSWNRDGWIYVSNSEAKNFSQGGVGAITFDRNGHVVQYKMVLEDTYMNCGGGRTPWNTWVSCEEIEFSGQIYQVDPLGERASEPMTMGSAGGRWESFAYDVRNKDEPHFFVTEDHNKGCTRRFTPNITHWGGDEWKMLHEEGVLDYLFVTPNEQRTGGTFEWIDDIEAARNNARTFYPQSEGIDIHNGIMYIVCKRIRQLFVFDLDRMTFNNFTTTSGLFDGGPDQMQRILGEEGGLLYFTEEGGVDAGVHARDQHGRFFTILESPIWKDETTGLSFSPDGKHLYIAYQENGVLYDITRDDGLPFSARSLDVKYHNSILSRRLNSQWIGL